MEGEGRWPQEQEGIGPGEDEKDSAEAWELATGEVERGRHNRGFKRKHGGGGGAEPQGAAEGMRENCGRSVRRGGQGSGEQAGG